MIRAQSRFHSPPSQQARVDCSPTRQWRHDFNNDNDSVSFANSANLFDGEIERESSSTSSRGAQNNDDKAAPTEE